MASRYSRRLSNEPNPGAFWMRILLLFAALVSILLLRTSCSEGAGSVFRDLTYTPSSSPANPSPKLPGDTSTTQSTIE